MPQFESVEEAYDSHLAEGDFIPRQSVDEGRIKASLTIAEEDLQSAKDAVAKRRYNSAYKIHYDALHQLAEAFLAFDKIKAKTHSSLFACLCVKHPELELHWDFFEKVRTKRNGIQYYGTPVSDKDWAEVSLEFQLYVELFKHKIEANLSGPTSRPKTGR